MTSGLMTVREVAELTRLAENTLYDRRARNLEPASFKLGGRVVYRRQDVEAWIKAQVEATSRGAA